ncbi:MAG: hypothetical protein ACLRMZ_10620 [Blautia marasmi]
MDWILSFITWNREGIVSDKVECGLEERNSGVILFATELDWEDIKPFQNIPAPLVVVDAWFKEGDFDTVLMDNTNSVYKMVTYLLENHHRDIGYIDSSVPVRNFYYAKNRLWIP